MVIKIKAPGPLMPTQRRPELMVRVQKSECIHECPNTEVHVPKSTFEATIGFLRICGMIPKMAEVMVVVIASFVW